MYHAITGYFHNCSGHWVAKLDCGHEQELKHNPPLANHAWVLTQDGRDDKMGVLLLCTECIAGRAADRRHPKSADRHPA